ncbi:HEAT repeat domain-containing protein [Streptomyces sp. NPDC016469]|uniref:HEAT repeat domain-containing protein n=1 Tax=Streptomyces sp. NPDC016469 TaxID=3157191 RepID=UPI0033EE2678
MATHPSQFVRQTAVVCWGRASHRDPSLIHTFAEDSNPGVRRNLAHALASFTSDEHRTYAAVTAKLRTDSSARVRKAAAQIP